MHCLDGNCKDKSRFDTCEYTYSLAEKDNAKDELKHSYQKQHVLFEGYEKLKIENDQFKQENKKWKNQYQALCDKYYEEKVINEKLKSEIEVLEQNIIDSANETYSLQKLNNELLTNEIKQLKAELEQSVKLPCKVGDKVYTTNWSNTQKYEHKVTGIITCNDTILLETYDSCTLNLENLGTHLFFSEEEAEQALKGGAV